MSKNTELVGSKIGVSKNTVLVGLKDDVSKNTHVGGLGIDVSKELVQPSRGFRVWQWHVPMFRELVDT